MLQRKLYLSKEKSGRYILCIFLANITMTSFLAQIICIKSGYAACTVPWMFKGSRQHTLCGQSTSFWKASSILFEWNCNLVNTKYSFRNRMEEWRLKEKTFPNVVWGFKETCKEEQNRDFHFTRVKWVPLVWNTAISPESNPKMYLDHC